MPEKSPVAEFDFIIVGAGSAGCLLANRLSANPDPRVLLVEAGGKDNWFWIKVPVGYLYTIANPRTDWCFTTEADPGLAGRSIHYARGRVIGGSSSINAMIHMRGQASDYDLWARATVMSDGFGVARTVPARHWRSTKSWKTTSAEPTTGTASVVRSPSRGRGCAGRSWTPGRPPLSRWALPRSTSSTRRQRRQCVLSCQPTAWPSLVDGRCFPSFRRPPTKSHRLHPHPGLAAADGRPGPRGSASRCLDHSSAPRHRCAAAQGWPNHRRPSPQRGDPECRCDWVTASHAGFGSGPGRAAYPASSSGGRRSAGSG